MSDSTTTALAALPGAEATAAWSFLVERHGPDVWRVVRSLHRHHQEAEDAYQDAWLHLRSAAASFRPGPGGEAAARAWVLRVACTRTLDGLRRMKVRRHAELLPEAEPAAPPPSEPVDPAVRERLHAALERLPDQLREAVLLHVVGGVTYEDLAVQLRTTVNNLRVRVHRALARLREDARLPEGEGSAYGGSALGLLLVPPGPPPVAPAFSSLPAGQFAAGAAGTTTSSTTVVAIAVAAGAGLAMHAP